MTVHFIPGTLTEASLYHDGNGEWFLCLHINTTLDNRDVVNVNVKLSKEQVRQKLLSKTLSIAEGP